MPNIIRIRNLDHESDLSGIVFPVDHIDWTHAKQINILDLKNWILSGFTGGTGGTGTSGTSGIDGTSGTSPCMTLISNTIRVVVLTGCSLIGTIDCYVDCNLIGTIDCLV